MKVWLVTIGEPVPIGKSSKDRLHRTGFFAKFIAKRGFDVTWWTSDFDHFNKEDHFGETKEVELGSNLKVILMHGGGYKKNVSYARIQDHKKIANIFKSISINHPPPDIIIAAYPSIELCNEALDYGKKYGIPVLVDVRDLWPDLFLDLLPKALHWFGRRFLGLMFKSKIRIFKEADGILGPTKGYVNWALRAAGRTLASSDGIFAFGYEPPIIQNRELEAGLQFWRKKNIVRDPNILTVCYLGAMGHQCELEPVIKAAILLKNTNTPVRFILCGKGDKLEHFQKLSVGIDSILFAGWVQEQEMHALLSISDLGLVAYRKSLNYILNIPNKPPEYLSRGLPLLMNLDEGDLFDLIQDTECGISYKNDPVLLSDILVHLQRNPNLRGKMSTNAMHVFNKNFVADYVYTAMKNHIESLSKNTK